MHWKKLKCIFCVFLLSGCGESKSMNGASSTNALPVISVSLGMAIEQVQAESTLPVRFYNSVSQSPSDDFHQTVAHQLSYVSPTLKFILPNMEQVAINSFRGYVTSISDRPAGRILTIDEAITLCKLYTEIIDKAGWQRETSHTDNLYSFAPTRNYTSLDEVRNVFLDKNLSEPLEKVTIASWKNGKDSAGISLKRIRDGSSNPSNWIAEREYSLTVELSNKN